MLWFVLSVYFLGFLTIAGTAYMIGDYRPYPRLAKVLWVAALVWLALAPGAYYEYTQQIAREYVGILWPHECWCARLLGAHHAHLQKIEIGDSGSGFIFAVNGPIDSFAGAMSLHLGYGSGGEWIISARILDKNTHRAVVSIDEGRWHVSDKGESWDFNYSDDALEVLSGDDKRVVLQIRVLPDRVQIQGESWDSSGNGIRLVSKGKGVGAYIVPLSLTHSPDDPRIEPMFKYPRQYYLGQTVTPEVDEPLPYAAPTPEDCPTLVFVGVYTLLVFSCPLMLFLTALRRRFFST